MTHIALTDSAGNVIDIGAVERGDSKLALQDDVTHSVRFAESYVVLGCVTCAPTESAGRIASLARSDAKATRTVSPTSIWLCAR